jgi:hypothetical protein
MAVPRWSVLLVAAVLLGSTGCLGSGGDHERAGPLVTGTVQTLYRAPKPYSLAQLRERPYPCGRNDGRCATAYVKRLTAQYGPRAALAFLAFLQRRGRIDPALDLHQVAHVVGDETARTFGANPRAFALCPQTFNYGCVHGFFIYVLGKIGTPSAAASLVCKAKDAGGPVVSAFSCYHGVGHGVMMARGYDLPTALAACNTLGSRMAADGCWQGVFMENVNGQLRRQVPPGVFSRADPLAPCDRVAARYRHECYINQAGWLVHVAGNELGRAARFCLRAARYVSACAQSLGLMVTNPSWQATLAPTLKRRPVSEVAWRLCTRFPGRLRSECVVAAVDNLANFDQLDVAHARAFCATAARALRDKCYREIGVNLGRRTHDQGSIDERCSQLPSAGARACLAGAAQGELPAR